MKRVLRHGLEEIEIRSWYERPSQDSRILEFPTESTALHFLYPFLTDPWNLLTLRQVLVEDLSYPDVTQLDDHAVLEQVAWHIVQGQIKIVQPFVASQLGIQTGIAKTVPLEPEEEETVPSTRRTSQQERQDEPIVETTTAQETAVLAAAPVPQTTVSWIKFVVVDDATDEPISGVTLKITLPDGSQRDYTTKPDGMIEIYDIDPGTCNVSCDIRNARLDNTFSFLGLGEQSTSRLSENVETEETKPQSQSGARILIVEEHKVQTGETLKSIAEASGMTWQELAQFNWGTAVPREINRHLHDKVGCTKKTRDGYNYMFTSEDDPGILYIPRPWLESGFQTEQIHTIRVKRFTDFQIILETEDGWRIPEADYEVKLADGSKRKGRLGKSGVAIVKDPPPGSVEVTYTDPDDIKAKALAAAARKAFDTRDTDEIYRVLKHSPTMVQKVIEAYDQYYNDYHGQGLVEDIYAEFTDERALKVVVGMLARAGVPTRENAVYVQWGEDKGDHRVFAAPELRAVTPGALVTYACNHKVNWAIHAEGAGWEYEWYCLNDRASAEEFGIPQVVLGPKKFIWEKAKWKMFGDHTVVCRVQYRHASGEKERPYYYEYPQAVEPVEAILTPQLRVLKDEELPNPHSALSAVSRYIQLLEEAEAYAKKQGFPPLSSAQRAEHRERMEQLTTYRDKLNERLAEEYQCRIHYPFKSIHLETTTQKQTMLRVCLRQINQNANEETWQVVDWTHPAVRYLTGVYSGTGTTATEAIRKAINTWDSGFNGNRYPAGVVLYKVPVNLCGELIEGKFETTGSNFLDDVSSFFTYVGAAAGILALVLAPIPGSRVAAAALYVAVFASTTAAVINIGQRYAEGFSNWKDDGFDALTIVGNCFGMAWLRGATLTQGAKTFILVGRVSADAAQGVLLADSLIGEYEGIMSNPNLTPEERTHRLLQFFGQAAASGAMIYLSMKGTKADIEHLKVQGSKTTKATLEDLSDPTKKIVIEDELPALKGHTKDKVKKTQITTEEIREHGKTKAPKEWPPKDDEIWAAYEITDNRINLETRDGYWFRANIDENGYVNIDVHTKVNGQHSPHLGTGRENYERMFHHFESKGHTIKGWDGLFVADNYEAVKRALDTGMDPEKAVLESVTGKKFWKPWADSKGYKMVVEVAEDHPPHFFEFKVKFEPK